MKRAFVFVTVIAIAMMLLAGCASPGTLTTGQTSMETTSTTSSSVPNPTNSPATTSSPILSSGTGMLQVYVTDPPPPDMEKILVDVKNLQVHRTGGGWVTVDENPPDFDLKELEGVQDYLSGKIVVAGNYTQIRFEVNSVNITAGGVVHPAKVPSGEIKLVGNFKVADGGTTAITLDFNGEKSVNVTGNDQYIFKPVVKLLVTEPISTPAPALELVSIEVTPASLEDLAIDDTRQFYATGLYSDGSTGDITTQVTWASSDEAIATIDTDGLATGVATGSADITASLDGFTSPAVALTVVVQLGS